MTKKFNRGYCGCHEPSKGFWNIRKARATIGGMLLDDKTRMNTDNPLIIDHILRSLDDLEARLHVVRCCRCGIVVHEGQEIHTFGESWCVECGTSLIESEAEDEGLRSGLAAELARQACFGKSALHESWKQDDACHPYWKRIIAASPEVKAVFDALYNRSTH